MKVLVRTVLYLVLAAAIAAGASPVIGQPQPGEYDVKAAFCYNFLTFVEWPPSITSAEGLRFCVMGERPVLDAFRDLNDQVAAGRKLVVLPLSSRDDVRSCDVLFIGPRSARDLAGIMRSLEGTATLTIGDTAGFALRGVIINFYLENRKVRFEINAAAARQAGITISSKLLKLAGAVYDAAQAGD
jgi:uncharacterized protein DUF4154